MSLPRRIVDPDGRTVRIHWRLRRPPSWPARAVGGYEQTSDSIWVLLRLPEQERRRTLFHETLHAALERAGCRSSDDTIETVLDALDTWAYPMLGEVAGYLWPRGARRRRA